MLKPKLSIPGLESYAVRLPFSQENFKRGLSYYLQNKQAATLDDSIVQDLFWITGEYAIETGIADRMRAIETKKDWSARGRSSALGKSDPPVLIRNDPPAR